MREIDKEYAFEDGYNAAANESKGGDLISREALKKALCEEYEAREHYIGEIMLKAIDNAPAVEPEITNDDLQVAMTESYRLGYELAETKFKRPQGEWIANPLGDYVCNKCSWVVGKFERNFCPNCGADMRKGGAENDK